ncbi:UNVERIFIED_CONTAM: Peroxisomal membrane protein 11A [Sesamum angustifolium]|uniref:Peroxisomal membrane protein 11A n=1 Tax=Sesamum angustifolium TaxID=2727405 RepID=A0AAW2L618_9LAMI
MLSSHPKSQPPSASTTVLPSPLFRLRTTGQWGHQHEIWAATGLVAHPYLGSSPPRSGDDVADPGLGSDVVITQRDADESATPDPKPQNPITPAKPTSKNQKDFLTHLEIYLAKRDGVDKLLKISRYATKIILASSLVAQEPLVTRLKSFESSVGVSRKAFRLGKFQDVNAPARPTSLLTPLRYRIRRGILFHRTVCVVGKSWINRQKAFALVAEMERLVRVCGLLWERELEGDRMRKIDEEERFW